MAKKKNSRKALAVALGIMGIAGLSVASASQLTVTADPEIGVGSDTFANCQESNAITVGYEYDTATPSETSEITKITFDGIVTGCAGHDLTFTLAYTNGDGSTASASPLEAAAYELTSTDVGSANTYTYTIPSGDEIPLTADLGAVNIVIQ